ncbi:hypothetical protein M1P56_35665 (plasmid) [Streptomyces sp. HU2014]|uniref:hypothetical protein n=1 Tax=Streptomyces sp. HU2014 TaxID=2939414 RepID=UPI00200BD98E|nr:hypothetical protein [Streptomyces sp. HU2014]UQI49830.1 hypothetical protein M1P56_35665 [Streptomyces sp. HU2014]
MSASDALAAHLGWRPFRHRPDCAKPVWEVDQQSDPDARRSRRGGPEHACPNEDCGHSSHYDRVTVRVLCRSCGTVHLISGEEHTSRTTTTASTGYGQPPKRVGGLWLYPGPPLLDLSWEKSGPGAYLCSLEKVERLTDKDIVGAIGEGRGARGGAIWSAGALPTFRPSVTGRPEPFPTWARGSGDTTFKTVAAAAKWVKAEVDAATATETTEDQSQ